MRRKNSSALLVTFAVLPACNGSPAVPADAPEMEALQSAYDEPNGEITAEEARTFALFEAPLHAAIRIAGQFAFVRESIDYAQRELDAQGIDPDLGGDIAGRLEVRTACPGVDGVIDFEANGSVTLEVPVNDDEIGPTFAGSVDHCKLLGWSYDLERWAGVKLPIGSVEITLDGAVSVHLGDPIEIGRAEELLFLVVFEGTAAFAGYREFARLEFRQPVRDTIETRVVLPQGGHVIVRTTADAIGVRERRGEYACTVASGLANCEARF